MSKGNESVFPHTEERWNRIGAFPVFNSGLTKREYFAALAMQGILARPPDLTPPKAEIVAASVSYADALLVALAKGDGDED